MKYLQRNLLEEIKKWIGRREIIAIKGPRQAGKTTLLEMIMEWLLKEKMVNTKNIIFISFEDREELDKFSSDPKSYVRRYIDDNGKFYFLIDEVHYCSDIGQKLKLLYDTYKNVKFIITGSSSLELRSQTAKFLVGRIFSFELLPLNFYEFLLYKDNNLARIFKQENEKVRSFIYSGKNFKAKDKDIFIKEILRYFEEYSIFGGYPEVVKAENYEEKKLIIKNIFNTYIEKDIIAFLQITDTIKFRKLVSALAALIGSMISYDKLISSCDSYFKEIINLLDILQQTYVIKLLMPFHKNLVTELRKNPKVYFYDSGLRNYAINNFNSIELREDNGKLAENFVLNELENEVAINFWRTAAKAEVDFILNKVNELIPIEVKFEAMKRPKLTKSFHSFLGNYNPKRALIITKDSWHEKNLGKTKIRFLPIGYI